MSGGVRGGPGDPALLLDSGRTRADGAPFPSCGWCRRILRGGGASDGAAG